MGQARPCRPGRGRSPAGRPCPGRSGRPPASGSAGCAGFSLSRGPTTWVLSASRRKRRAVQHPGPVAGEVGAVLGGWSRAARRSSAGLRHARVRGRPRRSGRGWIVVTLSPGTVCQYAQARSGRSFAGIDAAGVAGYYIGGHAPRPSVQSARRDPAGGHPGGPGGDRRAAVPAARLRHRQRGCARRPPARRRAEGRRPALQRPPGPAVGGLRRLVRPARARSAGRSRPRRSAISATRTPSWRWPPASAPMPSSCPRARPAAARPRSTTSAATGSSRRCATATGPGRRRRPPPGWRLIKGGAAGGGGSVSLAAAGDHRRHRAAGDRRR